MYRATYQSGDTMIGTKKYPTAKAAQDALMKRRQVGWFHYLGDVHGDASEPGRPCEYAPRNGGAVSVDRCD